METINLTINDIAEEIAAHKKLNRDGQYTHDEYRGILFGIQCLVGREAFSKAMAIVKETINK